MRLRARLSLLLVGGALGVLWAPAPLSAQSLRCQGRLVSKGDTAHTLRTRCGKPDFSAAYPVARGRARRVSATTRAARVVEEEVQWWTYVGDSRKFVRVVQIRRGRVQSIHVLSDIRASDGECKASSAFRQGARAGVVHVACGAPVDRSRWVEHETLERKDGRAVTRTVVRERWTYDPGPDQLLRIVEFENGRLVSVRTAERSPE